MYVRATTIDADPARIDEGVAYVRDHVVPAVDTLPGSLGLTMLADRASGITTITTAWAREGDRAEADELLTSLRSHACRALGGGTPVTELFELAVIDRLRPARPGFWTRTTRVGIDQGSAEEAIDVYTSTTLHDLRLLDGYCSALLLVDPSRGMGAVGVTFDSRAHLEASRDRAEDIRRSGLEKAGATASEVREAEVVIAGLRLPQTG